MEDKVDSQKANNQSKEGLKAEGEHYNVPFQDTGVFPASPTPGTVQSGDVTGDGKRSRRKGQRRKKGVSNGKRQKQKSNSAT